VSWHRLNAGMLGVPTPRFHFQTAGILRRPGELLRPSSEWRPGHRALVSWASSPNRRAFFVFCLPNRCKPGRRLRTRNVEW